MNKIKEIVTAYAKAVKQNPEDVAIAEQRYEKCVNCPSRGHLFGLELCLECGCPLEGKIFTPEGKKACPLGKWEV